LLPAKRNLAHDPLELAYRVEEGRIVWEPDPVAMHADDAFRAEAAGPKKPERPTRRDEAEAWLREFLAGGPRPVKEVIDAAQELDHSEHTLRRAFKAMGGVSRKDKESGGWRWSLPEQLGQEDDQTSDTQQAGQHGHLGQVR
jgi:AraC-like DNA-binding protein